MKRWLTAGTALLCLIGDPVLAQFWESTRMGPQQWELTDANGEHISWHQSESEADENGEAWSLRNDLSPYILRHTGTLRTATAFAQQVMVLRSDLEGSCQSVCPGGGGGGEGGGEFSSPTLWDDYSGFAFAGEAGALAVNDNWDETTYDYIPQFAPDVGTLPTPTGDPSLPGSSQVNPNAGDEYLVVDPDGITTALNDNTYQFVFIAKGTDLSGMSNQTLNSSGTGTQANPRWVIWWDPDTPGNVEDIKPWDLASGDVVDMPLILASGTGTGWINVVGLKFTRIGTCTDGVHDLLFYRVEATGFANHSLTCFENGGSTPERVKVYESYLHNSVQADGGGDRHAVLFNSCDECMVISSEGHDIAGDFVQIDGGSINWVIEDNDHYNTVFYDGSGNTNASGDYHAGEGFVDFKRVNAGKIYGNRAWAQRKTDEVAQGTGGSGAPIRGSLTSLKQDIDIRWNVFEDITDSGIDIRVGDENGSTNFSGVRNIIADETGADSWPLYIPFESSEWYLNTISNNGGSVVVYFRTTDITVHDFMGNFLQDVGAFSSTSLLTTTSTRVGYNAYAGTYTTFNKEYTLGEENTIANMNMGDFTYTRKKLTGPETSTITGIVPTTSTPSAVRTLVPMSGGDQIGSRSGIGVDDVF